MLKSQETQDPNSKVSKFHIDNGFLKYNSRVVLSLVSSWRKMVIEEHQSTPIAGHQGILKTYQRVKRGFYWHGMKADIKQFVAECQVYQMNKYETIASPGLLQPLPIPKQVWTDISMGFIVGLPPCQDKTVIMVVVDILSKYGHFVALAHPYFATMVV